jgi:SEC-C motif-containing protein
MVDYCKCCSGKKFTLCCEPYLKGVLSPDTPEKLMRSRYSAFSLLNIDYIQETMRGKPLINFDKDSVYLWAKNVAFIKLEIIKTSMDEPNKGCVEFIATFIENDKLNYIHENSEFIKEDCVWYYCDGAQNPSKNKYIHKIPRNSICPCGAAKKFKNCHGKGKV